MLVIGSLAAINHGVLMRQPKDTDVIGTQSEFDAMVEQSQTDGSLSLMERMSGDHWHLIINGRHTEFEIAREGSSGASLLTIECVLEGEVRVASKEALLALKLSHRFKKNSPHFMKTMLDVKQMRAKGVVLTPELELWLPHRERETYVYNHPKLNVSKEDFFKGDGVNYVYDHDSLHVAVALREKPAYTFYMEDGTAVMTSKEKFFSVEEEVRLFGVYEEACVLALERSQIPYDFKPDPSKSFMTALIKVSTSITSGWFREYAWESHAEVVDLYQKLGQDDYIRRFKMNQHLLKPHSIEKY